MLKSQLKITHYVADSVNVDRLREILYRIDGEMIPPLSSLVSIADYAEKLTQNAEVFLATCDGEDVGECAIYMNTADTAFLTSIGVLIDYRNMHIASALLEKVICLAREKKIIFINLKVKEENISAIKLYSKNGFAILERNNGWLLMQASISDKS